VTQTGLSYPTQRNLYLEALKSRKEKRGKKRPRKGTYYIKMEKIRVI